MKQGQFPAVVQLSALNGQNGFKINGEGGLSGWAVSGIGDINGDKYDDILVGAYAASPGNLDQAGRSYVIFGGIQVGREGFINLNTLNGANGFVLDGEAAGDQSGSSVRGAGDINADGYADFIIGANQEFNSAGAGRCYVIFGSTNVNNGQITLPLAGLNGAQGFKIQGEEVHYLTGWSVSAAGDVNQDGYDDLIVGAIEAYNSAGIHSGRSYIIFGNTNIGKTGLILLSELNGTNGFELDGEAWGDFNGYWVSDTGDINKDGYPDFLLSSPTASPNSQIGVGRSYVVFGKSQWDSSVLLADLNGTQGFKVDGEVTGNYSDYSGVALSGLGDINQDGAVDFIIGAPTVRIAGDVIIAGGPGTSYVIWGGVQIGNSGLISLAGLNRTEGFKIKGESATDNSGVSVSGISDINGDNYPDIAIGAYNVTVANRTQVGRSYVVFGASDVGSSGFISLGDINGFNGFKLDGENAGDFSGLSVSGAGDINGDGVYDLLIGAPHAAGYLGISYIVFGDIPPVWVNNQLIINQNQTIIMDSDMLLATDANHNASQILFTIEDLQHGQFQWCDQPAAIITGFSQQNILDDEICFRHDGGLEAPAYNVTVNTTGIAFISAQSANIDFDTIPVILNNVLRIDSGQTIVLNSGLLSATHATGELGDLLFNLTDVQHGYFNWISAPTVAIVDFYQQNITSRLIQFTHDNSIFPPAYRVSVTDGRLQTDATLARIIFNAPKISGQFPAVIELSSLNGQWGFKIEGESCCAPYIPQWAGDINADGYSDLLMSSPYAFNGSGRTYVLFGSPGLGWEGIIYLSDFNGLNGFKIDGEAAGDQSGDDEQEIGIFPDKSWDFNGDSYADIAIGAPGALSKAGRSYVVFGGPGVGRNVTISLTDLNGANGFEINGQTGDLSGSSISGIEDINGDGYADLLIGAPDALNGTGRSYLVFGGPTVGESGLFNLSDLNGTNGFVLEGLGSYTGVHVRPLGDVNADGINDVLLGAIYASPDSSRIDAGSGYVVFGGMNIGNSGKFDLSQLDGTNGFRTNGEDAGDFCGRISSGLRDFNQDGHNDFAVGAYGHNNCTGRSYVIYGQERIGSSGVLELSSLDGTNGFKLDGELSGDSSGYSLRWAGDMNGDTYPDLLIGNNGRISFENNEISRGYIVFGGPWANNISLLALGDLDGVHGFKFKSTISQDVLWPGGAGDINVDGVHDFVVGSIETGVSYVIYGDMAPVFMNNQLTIHQGETVQINSSFLLTEDINHDASQILLSIEDLQHGQFQWDADPQSNITRFYQQDVLDGHVYFQHDDSVYAPTYSVSANTTGMAWMPAQAATIHFYTPSVLINNAITIGQGQAITLNASELLAMHNGEIDPNLLFLISDVAHANFFISSLPSTADVSFTQQTVLDGEVSILHDDSSEPPSYQVSVTDGGSQTEPMPAAVTFFKKPMFNVNQFFVKTDGAVILTLDNVCVDDCSDTSNDNFQFLLLNPAQYGQFATVSNPDKAINSFLQKDIKAGQIQFVTDNSAHAPQYILTVINPQTGLNNSGSGSTLLLVNNEWPINQGEIFNVTLNVVNTTSSDNTDGDIRYTPSNVTHGYFALSSAPKSNISSFTQNQIMAGQIIFMPDGSATTPSIILMVDDGQPEGVKGSLKSNIDFATPPVLEHAFLKITPPDKIPMTTTNFFASDSEHTPDDQLIFMISKLSAAGHFAYSSDWSTPIFNFSQRDVMTDQPTSQVWFISDTDQAPSFSVAVWNGRMMCTDNCPRWAAVIAPESDSGGQNELLEGLLSMALSIVLIPVLRYAVEKAVKKYLNWRTDASIDSEIASAVLNRVWIGTYCLITRTRYEEYARAANYIVDALEIRGDELTDQPILLRTQWRDVLRYQEKEKIKSIIADTVKEELDHESHWCCRFFKSFCRPEITPEELRARASDIARRARPRLSNFFNPQRSQTPSVGFNELYRNQSSFTGAVGEKKEEKKPLLQDSRLG